jgi:microcystin-dependent protein
MPSHSHPFTYGTTSSGSVYADLGGIQMQYNRNIAGTVTKTADGVAASSAHNNLQPYITLNYIIKY